MTRFGPISLQRLNRDIAELFSSNLDCSASSVTVIQTADSMSALGSIQLEVRVFEGPYHGGRFTFCFQIPYNYPFTAVEVWAAHPIWHPNIDLRTGKVAIPLEWSPVLTLKSTALAVQMLMLEPSTDNPLNIEALAGYSSRSPFFEAQVQQSMAGGMFAAVMFPCTVMPSSELLTCGFGRASVKRSRSISEGPSAKRARGCSPSKARRPVPMLPSPRSLDNGISLLSLNGGEVIMTTERS